MENIKFDEMKFDYLFEYAKCLNIRGYYRMRKAELIEVLNALEGQPPRPTPITREYFKQNPDTTPTRCRSIKRCEHGRNRYYCKECGGKGIFEHDKQKYYCKECNRGRKISTWQPGFSATVYAKKSPCIHKPPTKKIPQNTKCCKCRSSKIRYVCCSERHLQTRLYTLEDSCLYFSCFSTYFCSCSTSSLLLLTSCAVRSLSFSSSISACIPQLAALLASCISCILLSLFLVERDEIFLLAAISGISWNKKAGFFTPIAWHFVFLHSQETCLVGERKSSTVGPFGCSWHGLLLAARIVPASGSFVQQRSGPNSTSSSPCCKYVYSKYWKGTKAKVSYRPSYGPFPRTIVFYFCWFRSNGYSGNSSRLRVCILR